MLKGTTILYFYLFYLDIISRQSFKATGMLDKIINIKLKDDNQIVTATTPNAACFFKCPFLVFSILQF